MRRVSKSEKLTLKTYLRSVGGMLTLVLLAAAPVAAQGLGPFPPGPEPGRDILVLTSTNNAAGNDVVVFKLNTSGTPSLSLVNMLSTGGAGGASGNAGALQFTDNFGAVVNYGSNDVSQLARNGDSITVAGTIKLAPNCVKPVSVALTEKQLFVVGANCAESHALPSGNVDGAVVALPNTSAAQIAVGESWAGVTMGSGGAAAGSGFVLQLLLNSAGALNGTSATVTLPSNANMAPLGAAFWGDLMGFNPAHSPDSLALVNKSKTVFPIVGPAKPYPTNAPCWLAKGPGNLWYAGNSPGQAVSIFFSDDQGGAFYKSVPVGGVATDITMSRDRKWLAVIYTAADGGHVAVFSIDSYGALTPVATSAAIGVASFSGVAFSE
jgi:hypothetical protein